MWTNSHWEFLEKLRYQKKREIRGCRTIFALCSNGKGKHTHTQTALVVLTKVMYLFVTISGVGICKFHASTARIGYSYTFLPPVHLLSIHSKNVFLTIKITVFSSTVIFKPKTFKIF